MGVPSVFIRTGGCNLDCVWCDTPYAIKADSGEERTLEEIIAKVEEWPQASHCVITGGEPTMAPQLGELTRLLHSLGKYVTIETNTTIPPVKGIVCDLISMSPKLRHAGARTPPMNPDIVRAWIAHCRDYQIKLVARGLEDLPEIKTLHNAVADIVPAHRILLMPLTGTDKDADKIRDEIVAICLEHGYSYATRLHLELFGGRRGA